MKLTVGELKTLIKEEASKGVLPDLLSERKFERVELRKVSDGYTIIATDGMTAIAKPDDIKKMGRSRGKWRRFFDEYGVSHIIFKGKAPGGNDEYLSKRKFLDKYIGAYKPIKNKDHGVKTSIAPDATEKSPRQGKIVPIVKGKKEPTKIVRGTPVKQGRVPLSKIVRGSPLK